MMYRAYNLELLEWLEWIESKGEDMLCRGKAKRDFIEWQNEHCRIDNILAYVNKGQPLEIGKIGKEWFPQALQNNKASYDVFLSHSHKDIDTVFALSEWLHSHFGLKCFIDYEVWHFAAKLQDQINDIFSPKGEYDGIKLYSYEDINLVASVVNTLLSTSLLEMMDSCECYLFCNTLHSVPFKDAASFRDALKEGTDSPWLYAEVMYGKFMRKKEPVRLKNKIESSENLMTEELKVKFELPMNYMDKLNLRDLSQWTPPCTVSEGIKNLDALYKLMDSKVIQEENG